MADSSLILVIEDEQVIRNFLTAILEAHGYKVIEVSSGQEALSLASSHCPDLILLDLGLPDMDGMMVLDAIRAWTLTPIIVLSARDQETSKVEALDRGADDYITKPFSNAELLARIRTALRRPPLIVGGSDPSTAFQAGHLRIDYQRRAVYIEGQHVHLTPIEFRLLSLLAHNAGRVLTHERIRKELWGPYASDNQLLRVNMANIRRKLERNPADPQYIMTEIGVGYRMMEGHGGASISS